MKNTTCCDGLYVRTLYLVETNRSTLTPAKMARGAGLSEAWISRLINKKMMNPGVVPLQCLHDYLDSLKA